jgi:hypothetical protein
MDMAGDAVGVRGRAVLLACILMAAAGSHAWADETVTLAPRQFAASSPAAAFQKVITDGRKLAASTTPAWSSTDGDLAAWGPAVIFALLHRSVPATTVADLVAPLESEGTAPILMFRTLGLYAAKSRVPFVDTPTLMKAVDRNLRTLERATRDLEAFSGGPGLAGWGSIGAGAWLAYLEFLYRDYWDLGDPSAQHWDRDAVRILDQVLVRGQMPGGKGFRRDPREDLVTLWPNVLALYALVKAYENQELVKYESAAIETATALEALRGDDGSYFSTLEKKDRDPRANAYLAGAFLLLFKDTDDRQYRDRALAILRWLTSGAAAAATAREPSLGIHAAYLTLLLDSVSTQPFEHLLGRRPMRLTAELGAPSPQAVTDMAARLRPAGFRYREVFDAVLHTLIERVPQSDGDFAYDYGDAPGYATEVLLAAGDTVIAPRIIQREVHLLAWPRPRDFDELSFGAGALFAALQRPDAPDANTVQNALRRYLLFSGSLAIADRYYFDWLDWLTGGGGFDYGPTVIGAQIAASHLQFADRARGARVAWFIDPGHIGLAVLDAADRRVWDATRHVYRARPLGDAVWLLPNAMLILDLLEAHHLTGEPRYLERAESVAGGLEVLWDDQHGAYAANSDQAGAGAYESLSTNSYAALGALRLFAATQKPAYRDRAVRIFDFITRDLYADGVIYHHVYHGRRAAGDIWCTGCNWRVLNALSELARSTK